MEVAGDRLGSPAKKSWRSRRPYADSLDSALGRGLSYRFVTSFAQRGLAMALAALAVASMLAPRVPARAHLPSNRPNILLLVSDDQSWTSFTRELMPSVFGELVDKGALFNRGYATTPLCCPSRAEILTGLYEHHTGVDGNQVTLERPTIVHALRDLGYRTSLAGKYLNSEPCDPLPEFDQWICAGAGQSSYSLKNPTLNVDGVWTRFIGYTTDILADFTVDFIAATPEDQPFFAVYSPTSPHLPANDDRCADPVQPHRPPSFDEDTAAGGKPLYQQRAPLSPSEIASFDDAYAKMTRAVACLDGSIATILSSLGSRGQETLVAYLSDNGFQYGEHRRFGKWVAYEESARVPYVVRYPPMVPETEPFTSEALVENIDIPATIAEILQMHWGADGKSLVPLLTGAATSVRDAALLERCQGALYPCTPPIDPLGRPFPPSFNGLVSPTFKYIENITGESELYDLAADPFELTNLSGDPGYTEQEAELANQLAELRAPPQPDTTIVTGPQGDLRARVATFTFFSQSRLATFQCRLTHDGVPGAWTPCDLGSTTLGELADGDYAFEVAATDENGGVDETPDARSFSIHATGPDVTILSGPPHHTQDDSATFTFSSATPEVTFECSMGLIGGTESWEPCMSEVTYPSLSPATYLFQARAVDPVGSSSDPPAQWLVNVDDQGPGIEFFRWPLSRTNHTDAVFLFRPDEAVSGAVTCRLDGGPEEDCSSGGLSASDLSERSHRLTITATDEIGNVASTRYSWTVDITPPGLTLTGPPQYTNETSATVSFVASERLSRPGASCALDGENLVVGAVAQPACKSRKVTVEGLTDGPHTLQVTAIDLAGNLSQTASWSWTVDTVAPVVTIMSGPDDPTSETSATFEFEAVDATPVAVTCSLDAAPPSPCESPVTYFDLAPGTHTFAVETVDAAGNSGNASWTWTIASLGPGRRIVG